MINDLKNLGLSENEAKVYLAMLELGPATMLEIASKAEINRPTAYVQVESLKKKGLVSTQAKGKKTLFIPESPENMESMLENEERDIQQRKSELVKLLPQLSSMYSLIGDKPQVRYFEGKEGLLKINDYLLKTNGDMMYAIYSYDNFAKVFPEALNRKPKRASKNIPAKVIYTSSQGPILQNQDKDNMSESKYISPDKLPLNLDITIYGDKIAIAALKGKVFGAIIEHQEIADSFKSLFNFIWNLV